MARPGRSGRSGRSLRPGRVTSAAALPAVVLGVALAGCGVPVPELPDEAPAAAQGGEGLELTADDSAGAALATQLAAIDAVGAAAVALLLGGDGAPGLLPSTASDRAGDGSAALVTATVTLAGDVGGERARVVLELVRDPLVGDLGAWQRDAPGVIDGLRAAVEAAGADPAALDAGLAVAAGALTRALGYALAVASAPDAALAAHAAEAAVARLEVVRVAIELGVAAVTADA
ncbi:MAG: hypothetical protein ACO3RG_02620 [Nitriliruptoraceae bacterium]